MNKTLKHEVKRASTWGLILSGLAAAAPFVPALAPFVPPVAVPVLLILTAIAKAAQGPSKESSNG